MPLSHTLLIEMATDGYFGNVGRKDVDAVMAPFTEDAVMEVAGKAIRYDGKASIRAHFEDFCATYAQIEVDILHAIADVAEQRAAVHFEIRLYGAGGIVQTMHNANHFRFNASGQIDHVMIFMTGIPGDGFAAGDSA